MQIYSTFSKCLCSAEIKKDVTNSDQTNEDRCFADYYESKFANLGEFFYQNNPFPRVHRFKTAYVPKKDFQKNILNAQIRALSFPCSELENQLEKLIIQNEQFKQFSDKLKTDLLDLKKFDD